MSDTGERRRPQMFDPNDPRLTSTGTGPAEDASAGGLPVPAPRPEGLRMPTAADLQSGWRWGLVLVSSAISLFVMSLALRFWSFVWDLFLRQDWIGWVAVGLAAALVLSLAMLLAREVVGVMRLAQLQRLRKLAEKAVADGSPGKGKAGDLQATTTFVQLRDVYARRPELAWARARLAEHDRAVMSGLDRLTLFDREVMAAIDDQAKLAIAQSARRVSVVTAITPFAIFDMGFVLYENLRMMRRIATAYGGRPGIAGLFQLASQVVGHVVATGGLALTDDLFGQFIGQGLAKRLSARAGQGMFNGGLTARLGVAAINLCRPMPFIVAKKPRFRDLALDVARGLTTAKTDDPAAD